MNDDFSYDIEISNLHACPQVDASLLRSAVAATLRRLGRSSATVSVAVVSDDAMAGIHQEFMNIAGPTDVLAFDLADPGGSRIEGEIVISADTAGRVAAARGHAISAELALYAVHGTLHLLGHDDSDSAAARSMHALEDEILADLGLGRIYSGLQQPGPGPRGS